jgi:hypothetical protein
MARRAVLGATKKYPTTPNGSTSRSPGAKPMEQYEISVTWNDIERILHRDFPWDRATQLILLINMYDLRDQTREIAACLKNSGGNFRAVCNSLLHAQGLWKEEIVQAEHPNLTRQAGKIAYLSPQEIAILKEMDKKQYLEWLHTNQSQPQE